MLFLVASSEALSFFRELMAYYTLIESNPNAATAPKDSYTTLATLDEHTDKDTSMAASYSSMSFDPHIFSNGVPTSCSLYGVMVSISLPYYRSGVLKWWPIGHCPARQALSDGSSWVWFIFL